VLRVEAELGSAADADAAKAWVEATRSGVDVLTAVPVERDGISGFAVSYTYTDIDGAVQSGMVVLLNDALGRLHTANLRFPVANVDLNSDEGKSAYGDLSKVMESFRLMPNLDAAVPAAEATPAS